MTVREMIELLAEFPDDMHVGVEVAAEILPVLVLAPSPSGGLVLVQIEGSSEPVWDGLE